MIYCPPQQNMDDEQAPKLIRMLLDESTMLKSLSPQMIMQIMVPFKISVNSMMDPNQCLNRIKDKLTDIIAEEKEQCVDYLTLPKFKNLTQLTKKCLKEILGQAWEKYQEVSKKEEQDKKCALFFCNSKNQKQVEAFHLGLFNFFKTSFFYGCVGNNSSFYPSMVPQNENNFMGFPQGQPYVQNNLFFSNVQQKQNSGLNSSIFTPNPRQVKVEEEENTLQNMKGRDSKKMRQQESRFADTSSNKAPKKQKKYSQREPYTPYPSDKQIDPKGFNKCKCKGKYFRERKYFECQECQKLFHFTCLRIPLDAVKKYNCEVKCPQCSLKRNNVFYEIIGEPVESAWIDQKQFSKLKISIKGNVAQQILKNQYSIQLRFLKFTGKGMFQWESNIDSKPATKKGVGLNQILIKNDMLAKTNDDQIKISLESGVSQIPKSKNQANKNSPLNYVVAFVVRPRTLQEIMKDKFEEFDDDYLDGFFNEDEAPIRIQIMDGQLKMIETPVRGVNCQHANIFDLKQIIQNAIQLGTESCFYCPKKCQNFKIDRKIQKQFLKIKSAINDPDKYPSEIYYHKNGTFTWQEQNISDEGKELEEDDNSDDIGVEIEDEDFNNLGYSDDNK